MKKIKVSKPLAGGSLPRQGDVLLVADATASTRPFTALKPDSDGSVTLAHGEVTGHRHRFRAHPDGGDDAIAYAHPVAPTEPAVLEVSAPAALRHEEHGAPEIGKGRYRVSRPYEYTGTDLRRVED